ncbi:MAG: hypothetical protein IKA87_04105 [Lentisphaeria bacterium]|nr:hypothetical protein [Lentisphaeria bacterium]
MKHVFSILALLIMIIFTSGCTAKYICRDSDLTVKELESRMSAALDPDKRFASAERFIQRFDVKVAKGLLEPPEEQMIEVKFARPGNFKISTSDDKGLQYAYIFNDAGGYMADYRKKTVTPLKKQFLQHLRTMREIADPVMELSKVFAHIDIKRCTAENKEFYLLSCRKEPKDNPLNLYISARDYRLRSLSGKIKIGSSVLDYSSTVVNYALNEGLMVADLTRSNTDGIKTESKLVYFKLNPYFSPDEFKIPVF